MAKNKWQINSGHLKKKALISNIVSSLKTSGMTLKDLRRTYNFVENIKVGSGGVVEVSTRNSALVYCSQRYQKTIEKTDKYLSKNVGSEKVKKIASKVEELELLLRDLNAMVSQQNEAEKDDEIDSKNAGEISENNTVEGV